ncbi:hypothetical protein C8F01DRAFT_1091156 [Mycena amicta]|nr:hypothetical protein C8F01DRAFT_1091156 [Mycena amicta]
MFEPELSRAEVQNALTPLIDDVLQELSPHLLVRGSLIDAPALKKVKILFDHLDDASDAHFGNFELIYAFQEALLKRGGPGMNYYLRLRLRVQTPGRRLRRARAASTASACGPLFEALRELVHNPNRHDHIRRICLRAPRRRHLRGIGVRLRAKFACPTGSGTQGYTIFSHLATLPRNRAQEKPHGRGRSKSSVTARTTLSGRGSLLGGAKNIKLLRNTLLRPQQRQQRLQAVLMPLDLNGRMWITEIEDVSERDWDPWDEDSSPGDGDSLYKWLDG